MARTSRWTAAILLSFLLGGAVGGAAMRAFDARLEAPGRAAPPARTAAQEQPQPRITAETVVVTRTAYTEGDCRQTLEESNPAPADWVGLTRPDLERRYPDAVVETFTPERVVITRTAMGCPYRGRTILLRQGRVAVYYGTPNDLGPLQRETDITADQLTDKDRARLENGVVVTTDEEVDALLEGLQH
ncbi:MAG: BofC C-terminal domain-containing protein [Firmicutes bacterium]|nr:BofC C-terminal domain-containing protein [Bacillota bacterium]